MIMETIVRHPGVTNVIMSQAFNRNKSTMHSHLKQLYDADLISIRQEGRAKRCFARDDVLSMLGKKRPDRHFSAYNDIRYFYGSPITVCSFR